MGVLKIYWRAMGCQICQKSLKICQILQKSQFSGPKNLHWEIGSLLYVKWAWFCSQKHKIECLSSITFDFIGCWKCDKLKKVRNCESNTQFWSPTSSEQCFEIHRSSVPISSSNHYLKNFKKIANQKKDTSKHSWQDF